MKTRTLRLTSISIAIIALFLVPSMNSIPNLQGSALGASNSAPTSDPMQFNVTLHGRGATFPGPMIANWTSMYHSQYSNVTIGYTLTGSGKGQAAFMNKTDDFDASDAPLQPIQRPLTPGVLHIPETIGSVTLSYNLPLAPQGLNLTGLIIAEIYQGQILNWNDPQIQAINLGFTLPNHSIITVHRLDSSGTTFIFTSFLSQDSSSWQSSIGAGTTVNWPGSTTGTPPPIAFTGTGNPGVASVIASTPYSIGYVELNYAIQNNFHCASVENPANKYVLPSLQTTSYAVQNSTTILPPGAADWSGVSMLNRPGNQTYPMASFTYILVYRELNVLPSMDINETFQKNALVNFLYWIINYGQKFAPGNSYVPLPPFVRQIDNASIASITFTTPAKNVRTVHLSESAAGGWNGTTPGPTITIFSGDTINLELTSTDGLTHQFFVDYNNNGLLDANEAATSSLSFSSATATLSPITPAIGVGVPNEGSYTYRDQANPSNTGTITILRQQVSAPFLVPSALSSSFALHIDSSKVTAIGSLIINMRTLQFSGNITEAAVDSTSGSITFIKSYPLPAIQLHTVPNHPGVSDNIAFNAGVLPYVLSTLVSLQLVGESPTITTSLTREVDMAGNGFVSILDVGVVFGNFNICTGNPSYNPVADITNAGCINIVDASDIGNFFNAPVFR